MAAWRSNLNKLAWRREKSPFPMILVPDGHRNLYVKRDKEENDAYSAPKVQHILCPTHTSHVHIYMSLYLATQ